MTIKTNIMFSLGLAIICCLTVLSFNSCKEDTSTNDSDTSSEVERKSLLQNYVEVPLDRANNVSKEAEERSRRMNDALDDK